MHAQLQQPASRRDGLFREDAEQNTAVTVTSVSGSHLDGDQGGRAVPVPQVRRPDDEPSGVRARDQQGGPVEVRDPQLEVAVDRSRLRRLLVRLDGLDVIPLGAEDHRQVGRHGGTQSRLGHGDHRRSANA